MTEPFPEDVARQAYTHSYAARHERNTDAARKLADLGESYGADMICGFTVQWWRDLAAAIDQANAQEKTLGLLDATHNYRTPDYTGTLRDVPVSTVSAVERVRTTLDARMAGLQAAVGLVVHQRWSGCSVLELAAEFEGWLLRDAAEYLPPGR